MQVRMANSYMVQEKGVPRANTEIRFSVLGNDSVALGVSFFAIAEFFSLHKIQEGRGEW
jgi:hypothetical protein